MAGEWVECTLGDVVEIKHGFAFSGQSIFEEPRGDILLTPGNFEIGGGFKADKFKYYDGPVPEEFVLHAGDLLVTMTDLSKGGDTLGFPAFVPMRRDGRRYLHNQRLGKVLIKDLHEIDAGFLNYLLRSHDYRSEVLAGATGTTVRHTSPSRICAFTFMRPPVSEQRVIAHALGTLDDKIELNRRISATLEAMARALFHSWFVDFDPVRAKLDGRWQRGQSLPCLPAHLYDLFPDRLVDSELGEIPEGWHAGALAELADLNPEVWRAETRPKRIRYVDLSNTKWGRIESVADHAAQDAPSRAQRVLRHGDSIVGTVRPGNGSFAFINEDGLTGSTGFAQLRPKMKVFAELVYLAATARDNIDTLASLADGGAYPAVRPDVVAAAPLAVAPEHVVRAFAHNAALMLAAVAACERESRTLAALRDTLLPKLVSGELRVKDAERFVAAADLLAL